MGRLDNKIALVTGAGQGIGEAIVELFAREGAHVVVSDLDLARANEVAAQIVRSGGRATACGLDVTDEPSWQRAIAWIQAELGGLDILVNNAGVALVKSIEDTSLAQFRNVMRVNVEGVFLGIKHAAPALAARAKGRATTAAIVNLASVLGVQGIPDNIAYGTSKAAVRQLSRCAAIEFAERDTPIRVNAVLPAVTDTPMVRREIEEWAELGTFGTRDVEATRAAFGARVPLKRIGSAAEIAYTVLFAASDESSFTTGAEYAVDGGRLAV
ncbi:SDR family NAD(P)-dependent oxidoreductase [Paraburkholderia oxyphila]|uniref:SDR family NAD(P)-dependent oxidoreductase n=1 Tax=Paraburkholderia oxyphila TaxID=614212 RepID=UPI0004882889|nr:SDR family oxidoreductase [Paraburkholderia oxyphila]